MAQGALTLAMWATAGYRRLLAGSLEVRTLKENLLTQIDGQFYLLTKPLLLLHVNIDPDLAGHNDLSVALAMKGVVLLALVLMGALQLRPRPWLGAGILWWFLHLVPTNSILPRLDVANDRQIYLAVIGPAVTVSIVLWTRASQSVAVATAAMLAIGLGGSTVLRNRDYRTQVSLWQATVEASPRKARVWNNLGYAYQLAGDVEAARAAYGKALELDPGHPKALFNAASLPAPTASGRATPHGE
jgi:tetratricopeptide (TPR) repeat protein